MREILFRGKAIDNGEWVYGFLIKGNRTYIATCNAIEYMVVSLMGRASLELIEVIPETVCEYIGLCDKNGNKIFEGDILKGLFGVFSVYWNEDFCGFDWSSPHHYTSESFSGFADDYEIIGNIIDNPELLED